MITQTLKTTASDESGYLKISEKDAVRIIEISEFLTLGRDSANAIVLPDDWVSSRHARIERKGNAFFLRDLRSRNGSYVNGARVMEAMLGDGDRIRLGTTELQFVTRLVLPGDDSLVSKNESWNRQLGRLGAIATSELPVLLMGPSGCGKEVLAQAIHRLSPRMGRPFVSVNCSALTDSLVESELFGHVRGSFTGATMDRKGAFEAARGGTLFLDEVGDLPLDLQPKLLRALENRQIRPVGSDRNVETDVRIIAATHQALRQKVADGSFRGDLYFRLYVVLVETPSLADRMEDFEPLLYQFGRQHRVAFSFAAIQRLKEHSWPGNIRELKNLVMRAKAYFPDRQIEEKDLPAILEPAPAPTPAPMQPPGRPLIREIEHEMIRSRLIANRGNQRRTAADLGVPKSTLHDRIKGYGIDVDKLLREAGLI